MRSPKTKPDDFILIPYGKVSVRAEPCPQNSAAWEALWDNGKVGYKSCQHTLPKGHRELLVTATNDAIKVLQAQIDSFQKGLERLKTMPEKDYEALATNADLAK